MLIWLLSLSKYTKLLMYLLMVLLKGKKYFIYFYNVFNVKGSVPSIYRHNLLSVSCFDITLLNLILYYIQYAQQS